MNEQKLFAGPRIRRMRKERARTQARMAEELGISTSYLNLIERNQRPLTARFCCGWPRATTSISRTSRATPRPRR